MPTKAQLYERANELDIDGRSTMNKAELAKAISEYESSQPAPPPPEPKPEPETNPSKLLALRREMEESRRDWKRAEREYRSVRSINVTDERLAKLPAARERVTHARERASAARLAFENAKGKA